MSEEINKKRFPEWMECKENIHNVGRLPAILEREVWWVAVGENVGVEINGKSERFSRPMLVYKKISKFGFLGVPLTSQEHLGFTVIRLDRFQRLILELFVEGLISCITTLNLMILLKNKKFAPTFWLGCVRLGAEYVCIIAHGGEKCKNLRYYLGLW